MNNIRGVFFDLGNTLRFVHEDEEAIRAAKEKLAKLAGSPLDAESFHRLINDRYESGYRKWAFDNMREAGDEELWRKWLLPDGDGDRITKNAHEMTRCYRLAKGVRKVVAHGEEVLARLKARGYRLGIISNLIGEQEIAQWLKEDSFDQYFSSVTLSSLCGIRKPDPAIYHLAAESLGVPLCECASVGDNLDRDITGAKAAGMGCNILFITPEKLAKKTITGENRPDSIIHDFRELLDLLPPREEPA